MGCPCSTQQNQSTTPCSNSNCDNCSSCKPCVSSATICHFVVNTFEEARLYKNSYVVVQDEGNSVYHVDSNGNPVSVSKSILYDPGHTPVVGDQSNAIVVDTTNLIAYYYDPAGAIFKWTMEAV